MTAPATRGTTVISDRAVRRIAERAATEALPAPGAVTTKGSATVRGRRADVAVEVTLPYPTALPEAVRRLQEYVQGRTRQLTGLDVGGPRVGVTSLTPLPGADPLLTPPGVPADSRARTADEGRTPRRWWSRRRLPLALLALGAALVCGALAVDLILVHVAHRPAAAWRTGTLHWLSGHGPGDPAVVAGACAVAALGLLMFTLALAPGHRRLLTVVSPAPHLRAAVDRAAVAALVRDAVAGTAGIGPVKVRVRRHRVTVRAGLAFGDRELALDEVRNAARRALADCALRRTPRLRVTVRPVTAWDPGTAENSGGAIRPPSTVERPLTTAEHPPSTAKRPLAATERPSAAEAARPPSTTERPSATEAARTPSAADGRTATEGADQ
ncbi:DUF6286 domain-containing Asp23/Gls24 family envelope stress response protein [Streptomyces sp. NPDC057757]|uniref:DUF6286 domain-containing Asp23/Gls24 family envelope stress response protein n=1 Tax=Streptomyces sp. NPDC057757 TaxID=3346241 RepID=UPI0036A7D743